ncbi:MAG: GDSL-type esterase/lipase family protein [Thermoanaerobaculia bacterium]
MTPLANRSTLCAAALAIFLSVAPAAAIDVIAFGDSLTFGVGDEEGLGYPKRLKKMLGKGSSVLNFGEPAEETVIGVSRIRTVLGEEADVLLLMEGTNDVTRIAQASLSIETTLANLDTMITRTRDADIEPVLSSVIPRAPEAKVDHTNFVTELLVGELRELAVARNVRFTDAFDLFDPERVPAFFDDFYDQDPDDNIGHLSGAGYEKLAAAYFDLLNEVDSAPPVIGNFEPGPLPNQVRANSRFTVPVYDFRGGAGLDLEQTRLLINGTVLAEGTTSEGDERKVVLTHKGQRTIGCRVVLQVQAQDRAEPPNVLDKIVDIYDVVDRTILPGDVDFDCQVDGADLVSFALRFGLDSTDPRYLLTWDFNRDGLIDETDLDTLSSNFGKASR